jgi:hypothetical protein
VLSKGKNKMKQTLLPLFLLSIVYSYAFAGTPHIVTGRIMNPDASVPADGSMTFIAYITVRPGEVQTQGSLGNGYSGGYWYIGAGNFPTAWSIGEILHVDFTNTLTGMKGSIDYTLTSSDPDMTPDVTLAFLVKIKVFLQGPYSGGVMTTGLNTGGYIPLTQPYSGAPWNYSGVESVGSIPNLDVVDWILVELRTGTASTTKVETRAAFLLKDGTVVDVDGSSDVAFSVATAGDYYIVIRHRNHLAIMSAAVVTLPNATVYDFTTALTQAYENTAAPMITLGSGVFGMYAGDASANGQVKFSGSGSDRAVIQGVVGASTLTNLVNGYYSADLNMNGQVKWSGSGSDRAVLQGVVGASTLTNLVNTQVP